MKTARRILFLLLTLCLLFSNEIFAENMTDVGIYVKGESLKDKGIIINGRTMVPLRALAEALDFNVDYDEKKREVSITKEGIDGGVNLIVDSKEAKVNGKLVTLESPSFIKDGRTMVPLRFIGESLGEPVKWYDKTKVVTVGKYESKEVDYDYEPVYFDYIDGSLLMPKDWEKEVEIKRIDEGNYSGLYLVDKLSKAALDVEYPAGLNGVLYRFVKDESPWNSIYDGFLLREVENNHLMVMSDSNFNFTKESQKHYQDLMNKYKDVVLTYSFRKEGRESFKKEELSLKNGYTLVSFINIDKNGYDNSKKSFLQLLDKNMVELARMDGKKYSNLLEAGEGVVYCNIEEATISDGQINFNYENSGIGQVTIKDDKIAEKIIEPYTESTDTDIDGYYGQVVGITPKGKRLFVAERTYSGSLSADGVGLGIIDTETIKHIGKYDIDSKKDSDLEKILWVAKKENIIATDNFAIIVEGGGREYSNNKRLLMYDFESGKTKYLTQEGMAVSNPVIHDDFIYFTMGKDSIKQGKLFNGVILGADTNRLLYRLDLKSGEIKALTSEEEGIIVHDIPLRANDDGVIYKRVYIPKDKEAYEKILEIK